MKPFVQLTCVCILLVGCAGAPSAPQQSFAQGAPLDANTLALSCSELATRNSRITARLTELKRQSQAQARHAAVTDAVVGIGLGAILGAGAQGGISGIRTASTNIQGIEAVRAVERGSESIQSVTDVLALAGRSAQLQRAMIEKGCS